MCVCVCVWDVESLETQKCCYHLSQTYEQNKLILVMDVGGGKWVTLWGQNLQLNYFLNFFSVLFHLKTET